MPRYDLDTIHLLEKLLKCFDEEMKGHMHALGVPEFRHPRIQDALNSWRNTGTFDASHRIALTYVNQKSTVSERLEEVKRLVQPF